MNTTAGPSSVNVLMSKLEQFGGGGTWSNTGGNCMAIELATPDGGYLLITDYEGPLTHDDLVTDEFRYGWCVGRYDAEEATLADDDYAYLSPVGEDYKGPHSDIDAVVETVRAELARTR